MFAKLKSLGTVPFVFYLIVHAKGPIERDRIGFGANNLKSYCSETPPLGQ